MVPTVKRALLFLLMLSFFCLIFPLRWGSFTPEEKNVDESQLLAGAITLAQNPRYYDSVEGTTLGPIATGSLTIGLWAGAQPTHSYARMVGAVLLVMCSLLVFGYFSSASGHLVGFLAASPMVPFFGLLTFFDYIAFNGEHPAIFCLSLALFFFGAALTARGERSRAAYSFLFGATAGLAPLAKLQAAPISVALVLCFLLGIRFIRRNEPEKRFFLSFFLGSLLTPICLALYLFTTGTAQTFWEVYLRQNLVYARMNAATPEMRLQLLHTLFDGFRFNERFGWFHAVWIVFALFVILRRWKRVPSPQNVFTLVGIACVISAAYAIIVPANPFDHYFIFEIWAMMVLAGSSLVAALECARGWERNAFLWAYFLLVFAAPIIHKIDHTRLPSFQRSLDVAPMVGAEAAKEIQRYAAPGDAITVWGWLPRLYVLAQRRQGTPTAHTFWEMRGDRGYLARFVMKLKKNRPVVFVDAVGPNNFGGGLRTVNGHENFPEVDAYVRAHYTFVSEIEAIRIYVLNERLFRAGRCP